MLAQEAFGMPHLISERKLSRSMVSFWDIHVFFGFDSRYKLLSHEKPSSQRNLQDSARIRQKFLHQKFSPQQCSYAAVFSQDRFLGKKFPHGISQRKSQRKNFLKEVFLLGSLLAGALSLSSLFEFSGKDVFRETTGKFLGKDPL
jgi:hypothetical protein